MCTCFMNLGGKSAVYDWLIVIQIYDRYESSYLNEKRGNRFIINDTFYVERFCLKKQKSADVWYENYFKYSWE